MNGCRHGSVRRVWGRDKSGPYNRPIMRINKLCGISEHLARADNEVYRPRSAMFCHPEHIRSAQCKLREGSIAVGTEMLPLRFAQGFGSRAQHDNTDLDC